MTRDHLFLRVGAVCMIVGSVAVFVFRAAHGDLPADVPEAALRFIASHPSYRGVHLGVILGVLIWVGGFVALSSTFEHRVAWVLGRLGAASVLIGAAVFIVDFSIDGFAGQALGDAWAVASPSERADLERAAGTVFTALGGTSLISISILWGLSLVLFGRAVVLESYLSWLGWTGLVVGAATFTGATAQFLQPGLLPGFLIYGPLVFIVQLWSLALSVAMWRRVRTPADVCHADGDQA